MIGKYICRLVLAAAVALCALFSAAGSVRAELINISFSGHITSADPNMLLSGDVFSGQIAYESSQSGRVYWEGSGPLFSRGFEGDSMTINIGGATIVSPHLSVWTIDDLNGNDSYYYDAWRLPFVGEYNIGGYSLNRFVVDYQQSHSDAFDAAFNGVLHPINTQAQLDFLAPKWGLSLTLYNSDGLQQAAYGSVDTIQISTVPEPAPVALILTALAILGILRSERRNCFAQGRGVSAYVRA
jgi:hypothetical protein